MRGWGDDIFLGLHPCLRPFLDFVYSRSNADGTMQYLQVSGGADVRFSQPFYRLSRDRYGRHRTHASRQITSRRRLVFHYFRYGKARQEIPVGRTGSRRGRMPGFNCATVPALPVSWAKNCSPHHPRQSHSPRLLDVGCRTAANFYRTDNLRIIPLRRSVYALTDIT